MNKEWTSVINDVSILVICDKCTILIEDVNNGGNRVWGIWELCIIFPTCLKI